MSSKVKIVLNRKGVSELLFSQEIQACVQEHADAAVGRLGEGYESYTFKGHDRAQAGVKAVSDRARKENLENNTLLKALK